MRLHFYKYQGAGNDFVIFDGRKGAINLNTEQIKHIADRHFGIGSDGLIVLKNSSQADFQMLFYNPDGTSGMMCGNGGRCIVRFAKDIKIVVTNVMSFLAPDGLHFANIVDDNTVALKMQDVENVEMYNEGIWLDSGTSHFVVKKDDVKKVDVLKTGKKLRNDARFKKHNGTNVDFYSIIEENKLLIRTYERGVENETLACGTGIVATALAYSVETNKADGKHSIIIDTLHDSLKVEFVKKENKFSNIMLIGGAKKVFEGDINL